MSFARTHVVWTESAREASVTRFLRSISLQAHRQIRAARHRAVLRRTRRELLDMPDHLLADIGLSRSGVDYVIEHGRDHR
jgi:uncharacterized protein YjiS (DUF1127 family)